MSAENPNVAHQPEMSPQELRARASAPVAALALAKYEPNAQGGWEQVSYEAPTYTY